MGDKGLPKSRHFTLEPLAKGVWAAIATDEGAAWANCGIVNLGGRTLVFDSGWTPMAGRELRTAAEILTGRQVDYLVNSHCHSDHVLGNSAFAEETAIVSTTRNRKLIWDNCTQVLAEMRMLADHYIPMREAMLAAETDATRHALLGMQVQRERQFVAALPEMSVRLPNLTFDSRLTLRGNKLRAELISYGEGHTESDVFLYVPSLGIVFMGDLLSLNNHPSLSSGDAVKWLSVLHEIYRLGYTQGIRKVVPGHGPVGALEDIYWFRRYLDQLVTLIKAVRQQGGTADDAAAQPIPAPFDTWYYPDIYADNMRFLYQSLVNGEIKSPLPGRERVG